jgi:hypothetical protein
MAEVNRLKILKKIFMPKEKEVVGCWKIAF